MSVSVVPSSTVALIEKTLLAELNSTSSTPAASNPTTADDSNAAITQLTKDFASLLKYLVSGNVDEAKATLANVQQNVRDQPPADTPSGSPLGKLLSKISDSLNSTNSTNGSLQDLATHLIENGQGTGSAVDTTA